MKKKLWISVSAVVLTIALVTVMYAQSQYFWTVYVRTLLKIQSEGALDVDGTLDVDGATTLDGAVTFSSATTTFSSHINTDTSIIVTPTGVTGIRVMGTPTWAFRAGSYGLANRLTRPDVSSEMVTVGGLGDSSFFYTGYGSYIRTTGEDGVGIGLATLVEATNTTGTGGIQGGQMMAFLGIVGGTEAAVLKTAGSDAVANMTALWLKLGANTNAVLNSGSRAAPLFIDNQINASASNGEEYGIFSATGGSRPDAWAGFKTTSSGYSNLFYFDATFNSGAGTCVTTDAVPGGNQDARIKVYYNGTQYYIPLYR